ncbi:MAG: LCP family protein [Clostridia bacterium]|nr:LCP family protein [Clostridia bacterium]
MRKANKLDFSNERRRNSKRLRSFIIAFAAFVVVLGCVSLLMFMKALDFDIRNLISSAETTTEAVSETTTEPVEIEGGSKIVFMCENSQKALSFVILVDTDFSTKTMTAYAVPLNLTVNIGNVSGNLNGHYTQYGVTGVQKAVEQATGVTVDRYIKVTESQLRSFLSKLEDVTVNIPRDVNSNGLILNAGGQSLSAELFIKYMNYCDDAQKAYAFSEFLKVLFSEKHINTLDKLFSYAANNSETNITIVDYKTDAEKLSIFVAAQGEITFGDLSEVSAVA